jgi:hypothetical protein
MGVLEAAARIVQLGGAPGHGAHVAGMRAAFEGRAGAYAPEDAWFEERSRAFWCDAVTRGRFGRAVEGELSTEDRAWLGPLERAHRGLFRGLLQGGRARTPEGTTLVDVWSGAEIVVTTLDEASRAELEAAAGQLLDARVVGAAGDGGIAEEADGARVVALLPGAVFHARHATAAIEDVLKAADAAHMTTHDTLDALLRMERTLRALSRVKAAYAYRAEALSAQPSAPARAVRRPAKGPS